MPQEISFKQKELTLKPKTDNLAFIKWVTNKNNTSRRKNKKSEHDFNNQKQIFRVNESENDKAFKIKSKKSVKTSCCELS
jgi:hypothetical protein